MWKQVFHARNARRLISHLCHNWQRRYFGNFAVVPETVWSTILADPPLAARRRCFDLFAQTVSQSAARDPATKALHWDMQTYLPGLFHQDDRMSMANSLESRVPLADPRIVRFAFRCPFVWKHRDGASKWILRQAVADVLPPAVLNRQKVGFDTPVARWMKGPHAEFVRDTLLAQSARERGLWNPRGLERWLNRPHNRLWVDVIWKALCVEIWAQTFLDGRGLDIPEADSRPFVTAQAA